MVHRWCTSTRCRILSKEFLGLHFIFSWPGLVSGPGIQNFRVRSTFHYLRSPLSQLFFFLFFFFFFFPVSSSFPKVVRHSWFAIIKSCQNLKPASNLVNMALASRSKIKKSLTIHHTLIKPRKKLVAGYPQKRAKFVLAYLFSLSLKSLFIPGFLLLGFYSRMVRTRRGLSICR